MSRVGLLAAVLLCQLALPAQVGQRRPIQADGVVRLLAELEDALVSADPAAFSMLVAADLPDRDRGYIARATGAGSSTSAAVRERARRAVADGYEVLVEVFVRRGSVGRLATWQLTVRPIVEQPERFELVGLNELAAIDDLLRLTLDPDTQFAVNDVLIEAVDLTVGMRSGSAFVARSPRGVTALVLRGQGRLRFAPPDPAEQGQLRIFAGDPEYETDVDAIFVRMNSAEFESLVRTDRLEPKPIDRREFQRAAEVFDEMSPRTFNLDLDDLTPLRWSIEPTFGSVVVEARTRRHGWLTYARTPTDPEDIVFFDRENTRNLSVYASGAARARRGTRFYDEDEKTSFDVLRHDLDLTFDPERDWIAGRSRLTVRVKPPGTNTITLRLASSLNVASVTSPDLGRLLTVRVSGQHNLLVSLPGFVPAFTDLDLDVQYSGRLPPQSLDREASGVDQDRFQETPLLIQQPEPRFMYSNRALWHPQGSASDFATARMQLTVPSEYQVVASGSPVGSSLHAVENPGASGAGSRSMRTVEYAADRPARYLGVVISRFVPIDRREVAVPAVAPASTGASAEAVPAPGASVNVEVLSTPRMAGRNRTLPDRVERMVRLFAGTIGEAPYPDFTLAAVDDNLPGGHSPAYFAVLHQPLPSTPYQWSKDPVWFGNYPELFLAHEVAHQWWGQAVAWKNYHEQWLSEGLAQYFAVLYAAEERGPDLARSLLESMRNSAQRDSRHGPVYLGYRVGHIQGDSSLFRSIVYNKSAVVLHMLRTLIGDQAFFGGLRRFYRDWRFRKAGTDDLRAAFAAGTPLPLERFFERWIIGASLPQIDVRSELAPDRLSALVRIQQSGEVFDLPISMLVQFADGSTETVVVPVTAERVEHTIRTNRPIRRLSVDDGVTLGDIRN